MKKTSLYFANLLSFGLYNKAKIFSEWLKIHTTYARLEPYSLAALHSKKIGIEKNKRKKEITISLTSYGARVNKVHCVIESLMQQTVKADKIILWLSVDEFKNKNLPKLLKNQEKRGLTINFCEDLKSYKKIIPTLIKHPDDLIITADDDLIYPIDHIERLYNAHIEEPNIIHCNRAHLIKINKSKIIKPYKKWEYETSHQFASKFILPTTGAGAIYFPGCFHEEVLNKNAFMKLCPFADDIWLKMMSAKNNTLCKLIPFPTPLKHYVKIPSPHGQSLTAINRVQNDIQLNWILDAYPDIKKYFNF